MKLFKINDSEFVAAETEAEACQYLRETTGDDIEEVDEFPLDSTIFKDVNGDAPGTSQSAEQVIREMEERGVTFPAIIGGTE